MRQENLTAQEQAHYFGTVTGEALEDLLLQAEMGSGLGEVQTRLEEIRTGFTDEDFLCDETRELEEIRDRIRTPAIKQALNDLIARIATKLQEQVQASEHANDELQQALMALAGAE